MEIKCCTCKHFYAPSTDEPCKTCFLGDKLASMHPRWEPGKPENATSREIETLERMGRTVEHRKAALAAITARRDRLIAKIERRAAKKEQGQ